MQVKHLLVALDLLAVTHLLQPPSKEQLWPRRSSAVGSDMRALRM